MMVLGNIDIERFKRSKARLEDLKQTKFALVAEKHIKDEYDLSELMYHLADEYRELLLAYGNKSRGKFLEELADVSNMVDLLFDYVEEVI